MNLTEFKEKCNLVIKSDRIFIILIVICVGIGAFGLGRLSKIEALKQGISIEAPAAVVNALNGQNQALNANLEPINEVNSDVTEGDSSGQVVASKNGTKYHFPWCSGGKTISETNKIYFNSIEEARAAGYTPAANCKGLK
ncbi:MAG TPA: hypothetical protein VJI33_04460 [Candidatus Paceibacterota bacterium]